MDKQTEEKLVKEYQGFIYKIASNYIDQGLPMEDLVQECTIGFLKAIRKYDPTKNTTLKTYAFIYMKALTSRAVRSLSKSVRLPEHIYGQMKEYDQVKERLNISLGREPTAEEISQASKHLTLRSVQTIESLDNYKAPLSLESAMGADGLTLIETVSDKLNYETEITDFIENKRLQNCINLLPPKYIYVLSFRYGLNKDRKKYSYKAIAKALGCSHERVRQIEKSALQKLNKYLNPPYRTS